MPPHEDYIASVLERILRPFLDTARSFEIDYVQAERCLSAVGVSMLKSSILFSLARRGEEAAELLGKSLRFLELARATGEKPRYDYTRHFSEGQRSAALSLARWLSGAEADPALLDDARAHLGAYYGRTRTLDRAGATLAIPILLYTEAYPVLNKIAERLGFVPGAEGPRKASGLLLRAFRIASAPDPDVRATEKARVRKSIPPHLFNWVDRGRYTDAAYALHALFPRPDGPPSRLIEDCWQYIPEDLIAKRLEAR